MPKATEAKKASNASRFITSVPLTPVRRLWFKLDRLRPGNRRHGAQAQEQYRHGNNEPDPVVDKPPEQPSASSASTTFPHSQARVCMALQNEDVAEDAVVITALSTLPFCCHEDLLTMLRADLIGVATALNAKLPAALAIPVSPLRTDAGIRNMIEFVVGLRTEVAVPPAPRAQRVCLRDRGYVLEAEAEEEMNGTPPTSPLARRGRSKLFELYGTPGTPRLERLQEEDEGEDRPMKRQKTGSLKILNEDVDSMNVDVSASPTPLLRQPRTRRLRSHSGHMPTVRNSSPTPTPCHRVMRSQSTKLPVEMQNIQVDTAFINTTRPRYRNRETAGTGGRRRASQPALLSKIKTTTPKPKARAASAAASYRPFLALQAESASMSSVTSQSSAEASLASSDSNRVDMKRRRGSLEAEGGMSVGIVGMNMRSSAGRGISETDVMD